MLSTAATKMLRIKHPIVQAGMARDYTNAELVASVSNAGGLGVLGCLNWPVDESIAEIRRIEALTSQPFGVNFVVEHIDWEIFEACLAQRVPVFTFFRGDPQLVVERVHAVGALVVYQVTTVSEAEAAIRAGADMLIAQGSEAGGHVGPIALSAVLPGVVAVAGKRPVLAAGAIVDGPSLAAAMCLGAAGAWMGTRFLATPESPALPAHKRAIVEARAGATVRSGIWDLIWGRPWPGVQVRAIRNALADRWIGREEQISAARQDINKGIESAEDRDDETEIDLLAGEGVGRISTIRPAGDLVGEIAEDAERVLRRLGGRLA
jgi:NAD(P)H-dependent flavin oxidoreductase YrpB (nitropropane dioxygenase family)